MSDRAIRLCLLLAGAVVLTVLQVPLDSWFPPVMAGLLIVLIVVAFLGWAAR